MVIYYHASLQCITAACFGLEIASLVLPLRGVFPLGKRVDKNAGAIRTVTPTFLFWPRQIVRMDHFYYRHLHSDDVFCLAPVEILRQAILLLVFVLAVSASPKPR
jgi:hypothetical protein